MIRYGRDYYPDTGKPVTVHVDQWATLDDHARGVIRRNYRWMRKRDVSPMMCRLILDSTMAALQYSRVTA